MKKQYVSPMTKKVNFKYEQVVATSGCSSGIWLEKDIIPCATMTPDMPAPTPTPAPGVASFALAKPCGTQKFQD